jgi:hypothetical protein
MCGIVGIHTAVKAGFYCADRDQLRQMMIVNSLRGIHSTGFFGVGKKYAERDKVNIIKTVGSPYVLFDWQHADTFFNRMISDFGTVVGHCRQATMGEISAETAHPFTEGHITLVHNGSINNYHYLKDHKKHPKIEVDSHLIAKLISEDGAEAVLPKLRGAFVLVWWDSDKGTLNIARNKERPLYIAEYADKPVVQFASEAETLVWNSMRANQKVIEPITMVPEYKILTFKAGSIESEVKTFKESWSLPAFVPERWREGHEYSYPAKKENMAVVSTIKNKKRVKHRSSLISFEERALNARLVFGSSMSRGDSVAVEIDNFEFSGEITNIWGTCEKYPAVEFHIVTPKKYTEDDFTRADRIEGVISSIYFVSPDQTEDNQTVRAFIGNAKLCFYNPKLKQTEKWDLHGKPMIDKKAIVNDDIYDVLYDMNGSARTIKHTKLENLSKLGCGWCTGPITDDDVKNLNTMILFGEGSDERVICPECSVQYCFNIAEEQRKESGE